MPELLEAITSPMLDHRFMKSMTRRIKNFGFELEMLPSGDGEERREPDEEWEDCDDCDGCGRLYDIDDETGDESNHRNCESCRGNGGRYYFPDEADYGSGSDDFHHIVGLMYSHDLVADTSQHEYHCGCCDCAAVIGRSYPLTVQADCSVGVEFVSRILRADHDDDIDVMGRTAAVLTEFYKNSRWKPNGSWDAGNHVHVSISGRDDAISSRFHTRTRRLASRLMDACYAGWDWTPVADGGCGNIRHYNPKPRVAPRNRYHDILRGAEDRDDDHQYHRGWDGAWLRSPTGYGTAEHRLWNTPIEPQRLYVSTGVSLALTRWAYATVIQSADREQFAQQNSGAMTEFVAKHVYTIAGQIASYIPPAACFDIARKRLELLEAE